jgi:hypothetical protein
LDKVAKGPVPASEVGERRTTAEDVVVYTEFGTSAEDLARMLASGPPYHVRYTWAGGQDPREQGVVTEALAACFGAKTLESEQTIGASEEFREPLAQRIKFLFWLLKAFDLSLGFTHGWGKPGAEPLTSSIDGPSTDQVYRVTIRIDRSRLRGYVE